MAIVDSATGKVVRDYNVEELKEQAKLMRGYDLVALCAAGSGHAGGTLSIMDIAAALYLKVLNHDPKNPNWAERDRVIWSTGHKAPSLYLGLGFAGYYDKDEVVTLRKLYSRFQGHPHWLKLPGVEASTGSLGQGLSIAVGLAIVWGARTFAGTNAFDIVDPIVAIAVALFILKIGVQLTLSSASHLLDHSLPADELRTIEAILKSHPEVLEWHNLRTRKSGSQRYVEAHVTLRGDLTLSMAHTAAHQMEKAINAALPSAQATLHVDPPEALPPHRRPPTASSTPR